jgi:cyclase
VGNPRLIPVVSLIGNSAVKTKEFSKPKYVGDPANTVALFDSFEVEELIVLNISASFHEAGPSISTLNQILENAFMPIAFGGGIQTLQDADLLFSIGFDKVIIRSNVFDQELITNISGQYGSQAVTGCLDFVWPMKNLNEIQINGNICRIEELPAILKRIEDCGVGELVIQDVAQDGLRSGLRTNPLLLSAVDNLQIPIVAMGGCRDSDDAVAFIRKSGCHSVAASTTFLFRPTREAVLINFPPIDRWRKEFWSA